MASKLNITNEYPSGITKDIRAVIWVFGPRIEVYPGSSVLCRMRPCTWFLDALFSGLVAVAKDFKPKSPRSREILRDGSKLLTPKS